MMDHFYKWVQGWSAFLPWYKEAVEKAPTDKPSLFVEIGCWKGKSAAYMGVEIANSNKPISFVTIDTFQGSDEEAHRNDPIIKEGRLEEHARKNLLPVTAWVQIVRSPSVDAAANFADGSVDFILIDGDHTYEGVLADLRAWYPKVKSGGVIAGDDWRWKSVRKAVEEFFWEGEIEPKPAIITEFGPEHDKCWRVKKL
jgi:predicted O-methyltransferase YrrM